MSNLKELRNRIASVQATRKITRAMQMVAAAKLRRAQEAAESARPYADHMAALISSLDKALAGSETPPLLNGTGSSGSRQHQMMVIVTSERGLCGPFNSSIIRLVREHVTAHHTKGRKCSFYCIGKKGREMIRRIYPNAALEAYPMLDKPTPATIAQASARHLLTRFEAAEIDEASLFYAHFHSVIAQKPIAQALMPIAPPREDGDPIFTAKQSSDSEPHNDLNGAIHEYEPDEKSLLDALLKTNVSCQIQRAVLESAASEQGARMTAMDNATRNAGDMIDRITLLYNRTRQAMITKELVEIISGAEAL